MLSKKFINVDGFQISAIFTDKNQKTARFSVFLRFRNKNNILGIQIVEFLENGFR